MRRTEYVGDRTNEISFPLGGIGSGSIGLAGNGRLIDWEIFNRPNKESYNGFSHIAVKAERQGKLLDARVLNGDVNKGYSGPGTGLENTSMAGFPHFKKCVFYGEFPLAEIQFEDDHFPGKVTLRAFNPFIPLNDTDSSIPAAFMEVEFQNDGKEELQYSAAFTVRNPDQKGRNQFVKKELRFLTTQYAEDHPQFGELCLATDADGEISHQEYWYRGGWSDSLETYWRNFTEQSNLKARRYEEPGDGDHGTLCVKQMVPAGESVRIRFILSWNYPNNYTYWNPNYKHITWKNYYAVLFSSAQESAAYGLANWDRLYGETKRFKDELYACSLPDVVIEAISATMSVLKTATVLRLEDGSIYGWEGLHKNVGSCEGTCTHVWNYAYVLPFLFPKLERSIRNLDYRYNQDESGRMQFRMMLPLERPRGTFRACVDGQMGGIVKVYREWKISGDDLWLKEIWPAVKKSLEYAWSEDNEDRWDLDQDGVLEGRQHHTLDMALFGPSSWLEGFYLAALKAGEEMARYLGEEDSADEYRELFERGKAWSEEHLFNGRYYIQQIDLKDASILEPFEGAKEYWNKEVGEIKYQIGEGCEIDQICAQWHANIVGLGTIFDKEHVKTALSSLYQQNVKRSMRDFYNPWRLFCLNDEGGAVICEYPEGTKKPAIPIPYCQETMHGFEYQLAALMISEGMIEEGVEIVAMIRDRYDGKKRNPWNEIECGNNYARSMASYSMIPIFSGFIFDMPKGVIGFNPILQKDVFRCIWSLDSAWGNVQIKGEQVLIQILSGQLTLRELQLPFVTREIHTVRVDGQSVKVKCQGGRIQFDEPMTVQEWIQV